MLCVSNIYLPHLHYAHAFLCIKVCTLNRARALYDYPIDGDTLQIEDEEIKLLRFRKNDIINVYEQDPSGWYVSQECVVSMECLYDSCYNRWAGEHNGLKVYLSCAIMLITILSLYRVYFLDPI